MIRIMQKSKQSTTIVQEVCIIKILYGIIFLRSNFIPIINEKINNVQGLHSKCKVFFTVWTQIQLHHKEIIQNVIFSN